VHGDLSKGDRADKFLLLDMHGVMAVFMVYGENIKGSVGYIALEQNNGFIFRKISIMRPFK